MPDLLSNSKNDSDDNSKSDTSSTMAPAERQPLLSFFKGAATKKSPTKKQQKDKSPAVTVPAPLHSISSSTDDAIQDTDSYTPNYGSIGESSSSPQHYRHRQQQRQQQQQEQDHEARQQRHPTNMRIYIALTLFLGIIFMASLVLLLMAPRFAQKHFEDGVQLQFQQASIVNATSTSDGVNIITMNIVGSITLLGTAYNLSRHIARVFGDIQLLDTTLQVFQSPPTTPAWIPSPPPVSPYQPSSSPAIYQSSLGTIKLPGLTLSSASNVTLIDFVTQFVVVDPTGLMNFCKDALTSKQVGWQVIGSLPLRVGWLPMENSLALDKVINIDGMDGLKQTELKDMVFPGTHPLGGILLEGTVGIYNPSKTLSITIGDVDFGIFLPGGDTGDDEMIAVVQAMDTELLGQRMNHFNVKGRTLPLDDNDTNKRQLMEQFLTRYLHGNASIVHVRGSNFGPDDGDSFVGSHPAKSTNKVPDWLQKALASMTLAVPFPGATQMDIIQSLTLDNIKIDFSMVTKGPLVSCDSTALLQLPKEMKFELDVVEIDPIVYIYLEHDSKEPFAVLHPNRPCPSRTIHRSHGGETIPKDMFMVKSRINKAPFKHSVSSGHRKCIGI
ncbi:hypothetical protein [Absidia glauca]|uniref:Uncharacterized protein n=1 Tax=Absidia glauca TaxID=4829 RepID=A0A168LBT7_ABSGL|nr:hypothetical protein [Absidia glauca]